MHSNFITSRRKFLKTSGLLSSALIAPKIANSFAEEKPGDTYETHMTGIRILPGVWRPHYPWEHIAWVSPPWASQDYIWLDIPEAIFTSQGLIYLSHVNPPIHTVYQSLPKVPWQVTKEGIAFERQLPSGIKFGTKVFKGTGPTVDLEIFIENGSKKDLNQITLQTCAFLRAIEEFADYRQDNKRVHVADDGWIPMAEAAKRNHGKDKFRVGWRNSGRPVADQPVAITLSNEAERLVAMTWYDDTLSMVGNPRHPCFHADPLFPDIPPGKRETVRGKLIFHDGPLEGFQLSDYPLG